MRRNTWKVLLLAALAALLIARESRGHSWYPRNCCHDDDCKPVPCDELREGAGGLWKYENKQFQPWQVHPSQDRYCHVCFSKKHGTPYCVFIQFGT